MPKDDKLSLDDYVSFFDSNKQIDLVAKKLMQIISMHGFVKSKPYPKNAVIDAIKSIDLMEPSRSTLNDENISSNAFMTLEDVISDLKQLNWQECCVTSIQTVNSANYDSVLNATDAPLAGRKSKRLKTRQSVCSSAGSARVAGVGAEEDE
ncbi:hypothetical protein Vadar_020701 [Vaccinium darrowii]|uniref:Uncharacterized protein n=1 Tax=Vaccinium darrowii TaxID=229202 RepID=A0ACB7XS50_9ERIC|nr:hypothetical protein Vadar_020701 [Vaccinium darrowii]